MALQLSPQEIMELVKRAGDGPMVAQHENGLAHIVFWMEEEAACYCFEVEADEVWMQTLVSIAPRIVWARTFSVFMEAATTFWPHDESVLRLKALGEFNDIG